METSEKSENTTYHQPTLFAEGSLVSLTVLPGSEEAQKMTVTSGRNISALLTNSDPAGLFLKTCLESLQPFSTRCYLTWKVSTTPQSRLLFRLVPSMPRIDGTEYFLLHTPTSTANQLSPSMRDGRYPGQWFPTPSARDWKGKTGPGYKHHSLPDEIGGLPNPSFVEEMMGFPVGWTNIDEEPSETP